MSFLFFLVSPNLWAFRVQCCCRRTLLSPSWVRLLQEELPQPWSWSWWSPSSPSSQPLAPSVHERSVPAGGKRPSSATESGREKRGAREASMPAPGTRGSRGGPALGRPTGPAAPRHAAPAPAVCRRRRGRFKTLSRLLCCHRSARAA